MDNQPPRCSDFEHRLAAWGIMAAGYASMMSKAIASRVRVMPAAAAMPTIKHKG